VGLITARVGAYLAHAPERGLRLTGLHCLSPRRVMLDVRRRTRLEVDRSLVMRKTIWSAVALAAIVALYLSSYKILCWCGVMDWFLRSECSYCIFMSVKTGNTALSDAIATVYSPIILADGRLHQHMQGVSAPDNWRIAVSINWDREGHR
jgi:hypothetical protein